MINKKTIGVTLIIIILSLGIFFFVSIDNGNELDFRIRFSDKDVDFYKNFDFSKVEGLLIYSDWEGYIFANKDDKIYMQIPVFDFNNLIEKGFSINIENFSIGEVEDLNVDLKNSYKEFKQYIVEFTFIPKEIGLFDLNNIKLNITIDDHPYEEILGKWIFEIQEKPINSNVRIRGGSLLTHWTEVANFFEFRTELENTSIENVYLDKIEIDNENIKLESDILDDVLTQNETRKFYKNINVSKANSNYLIKPKLIYKVNNLEYKMPLNQTLYVSTVSAPELIDLIIDRNMITKNDQ